MSPRTKTRTRIHSDVHPEKKRNEGTFACSPGTNTGTRAHSPKQPFYKTVLLSPGKKININILSRPTNPPKIQKYQKNTAFTRIFFRKVRANFCLLPCDIGQEPNGSCSEKLVQMNFFILLSGRPQSRVEQGHF